MNLSFWWISDGIWFSCMSICELRRRIEQHTHTHTLKKQWERKKIYRKITIYMHIHIHRQKHTHTLWVELGLYRLSYSHFGTIRQMMIVSFPLVQFLFDSGIDINYNSSLSACNLLQCERKADERRKDERTERKKNSVSGTQMYCHWRQTKHARSVTRRKQINAATVHWNETEFAYVAICLMLFDLCFFNGKTISTLCFYWTTFNKVLVSLLWKCQNWTLIRWIRVH